MEALLCGAGEHWSPQQLADSMKFDHGYTSQSVPVRCACTGVVACFLQRVHIKSVLHAAMLSCPPGLC